MLQMANPTSCRGSIKRLWKFHPHLLMKFFIHVKGIDIIISNIFMIYFKGDSVCGWGCMSVIVWLPSSSVSSVKYILWLSPIWIVDNVACKQQILALVFLSDLLEKLLAIRTIILYSKWSFIYESIICFYNNQVIIINKKESKEDTKWKQKIEKVTVKKWQNYSVQNMECVEFFISCN